MSSTELDLPLLPSAEQIRRREFATIRRGYDPEQVRDYLQQVAAQVETLEGHLREIRLKRDSAPTVIPESEPEPTSVAVAEPASPNPDAYDRLADRLAELIRVADGQAEKILSEAQAEATRSLGSARADADRIRTDAQARAEEARQQGDEVLQQAREEAERVLSTLSARREHLVTQLQRMQSRLLGVAQELETALGTETDEDGATVAATPSGGGTAPAMPGGPRDDETLDPRYEDLWVTSDPSALNVADIPAIDIDFDDDEGTSS
jgi:DivIVA domain-containing protein